MRLPAPLLRRNPKSHKGDFGHVFIIASSKGMTGAGVLCADAAMRAGCGMATIGVPETQYRIVARRVREVMTRPLKDTGSGQLSAKAFKQIKELFKKIDVLVATTIIENGLDLPNVNTLIVADATKLGLAEAYQIRGRVGRSHIQAFAYFLFGKHLSEKAKMRLDALKEAEELGSGYKIALRDLEIRGAGNILGREQSGNINAVGLNLYCQMLAESIEKLKSLK